MYVISYIPWALIENHQLLDPGLPLVSTAWPPGHTGQTLLGLTGEMYRYHNNLSEAHAASSPWWAWPLNLKPVWFYQGSFAGDTAAAIYDAGNVVLWWMGIPAMAFVAYQAFRRRSLALALILVAFLAQWVSWARIDRAAFQYHYYTSLPFVFLALGVLRRRGLARGIAANLAVRAGRPPPSRVMGPVILWMLRLPLCALAGVEQVQKGSQACNGNPGNLVVTPSVAALMAGILILVIVMVRFLMVLGRSRPDGRPLEARGLVPLARGRALRHRGARPRLPPSVHRTAVSRSPASYRRSSRCSWRSRSASSRCRSSPRGTGGGLSPGWSPPPPCGS